MRIMAKTKPNTVTTEKPQLEAVAAKEAPPVETPTASLQSKLDHAAEAFESLQPDLGAIEAALLAPLKGDLQRAAIAALGVASWAQGAEAHRRFTDASKCEALHFKMSSITRLERASLAAWYVRHHALLSSSTTSDAKLSEDLDKRSLEVRDRMFKCGEYNLDDIPEAVKIIDAVRPGTGYLDRANDLFALANLYAKYTARLSEDRRRYRSDDEQKARALYVEILQALGLVAGVEGVDWIEMGARVWYVLREVYSEVEAVGRCLYRNENPDRLFPNLVAASRDARAPSKADAQTPVTPPADPSKPTG